MNNSQIRESFLKQIKENPYDEHLRKIFADWLEENGDDDEAQEQRRRATVEWQQADKWMHEFAAKCGETCTDYGYDQDESSWIPITYDNCIQAGYNYVKHGDYLVQHGDDSARNLMSYEDNNKIKFWDNWRIITGEEVTDEELDGEYGRDTAPFSCSC